MRQNDDGKTVAAMDVLLPKIGEVIGGSQREERLEYLDRMLQEKVRKWLSAYLGLVVSDRYSKNRNVIAYIYRVWIKNLIGGIASCVNMGPSLTVDLDSVLKDWSWWSLELKISVMLFHFRDIRDGQNSKTNFDCACQHYNELATSITFLSVTKFLLIIHNEGACNIIIAA